MTRPDSRLRTSVCDLLGCEYPVLLAGMGGVSRHELAAAVAEAGGFGMLGMVRESPELIAAEIEALKSRTRRPFAVNLIPAATDAALLDAELGTCLDLDVPAMCFFWDVREDAIARVKKSGALLLHQVGSLEAARQAEAAGADVVIVQGVEAGGHVHGTTSSLVLVEAVARALSVPVIASGGFATGGSLIAALALGAEGIHCGTAFLATEESFAHDYHKQRIVMASAEDTVYTDAFALNWPPGSPVRVIANSVIDSLGGRLTGYHPDDFARDAIADEGGRPILKYSTDSPLRSTSGDLEAMALFAGHSTQMIDGVTTVQERMTRIVTEAGEAIDRLAWLVGN